MARHDLVTDPFPWLPTNLSNILILLARPAGFEPATLGLEGRCSIRMSYGRMSYRRTSWVGFTSSTVL